MFLLPSLFLVNNGVVQALLLHELMRQDQLQRIHMYCRVSNLHQNHQKLAYHVCEHPLFHFVLPYQGRLSQSLGQNDQDDVVQGPVHLYDLSHR